MHVFLRIQQNWFHSQHNDLLNWFSASGNTLTSTTKILVVVFFLVKMAVTCREKLFCMLHCVCVWFVYVCKKRCMYRHTVCFVVSSTHILSKLDDRQFFCTKTFVCIEICEASGFKNCSTKPNDKWIHWKCSEIFRNLHRKLNSKNGFSCSQNTK